MNVLEKILEEIEDHAIEFESFGMCDDYVSVGWAKDIIRSHMGDVPKCRECSRRKFYMQGYEDGKKNDGWIPVSEKLPEVGKMVKVTVHSSEWIGDYYSYWVPEEEKTYIRKSAMCTTDT
jgi:hypothetical protein